MILGPSVGLSPTSGNLAPTFLLYSLPEVLSHVSEVIFTVSTCKAEKRVSMPAFGYSALSPVLIYRPVFFNENLEAQSFRPDPHPVAVH